MKKINVYLLTGFLGAGKTSLLQTLLEKVPTTGSLVLMNEFGEVSIDAQLLDQEVMVEELNQGCLCCSNHAQFEQVLATLTQQEQWQHVFIECSGAALPLEIIETICDPQYSHRLQLVAVYAVLNASQFLKAEQADNETFRFMQQQLLYASQVLITRSELLDAEALLTLSENLQQLGFTSKDLAYRKEDISLQASSSKILPEKKATSYHSHSHLHLHSVNYTFEQKLDRHAFQNFLQKWAPRLLRMKGFIYFNGEESCYLVQVVQRQVWLEPYFAAVPANMVFIGQHVDETALLNDCTQLEMKAENDS